MDNTFLLLENIYNTLQEIEVKGEKNCSYIIGISNAIKKHLKELKEMESEKNDFK